MPWASLFLYFSFSMYTFARLLLLSSLGCSILLYSDITQYAVIGSVIQGSEKERGTGGQYMGVLFLKLKWMISKED